MELFVVFFGVYAAFLLNRFDSYRRDEHRRRQILDALEQEVGGHLNELQRELGEAEEEFGAFKTQLAEKKMPGLGIRLTNPSYDAADDATFLAAGGLELLDMQTITSLHRVDNQRRVLAETLHNLFELSVAELSNHDSADFYDPVTHNLKPQYDWYPYVDENILKEAEEVVTAEKKLLAQIQVEQHAGMMSFGGGSTSSKVESARTPAPKASPS